MLFQIIYFDTVLKLLNVNCEQVLIQNNFFFGSEAIGFKGTFQLIPPLYPLPSRETVPLKISFGFIYARYVLTLQGH